MLGCAGGLGRLFFGYLGHSLASKNFNQCQLILASRSVVAGFAAHSAIFVRASSSFFIIFTSLTLYCVFKHEWQGFSDRICRRRSALQKAIDSGMPKPDHLYAFKKLSEAVYELATGRTRARRLAEAAKYLIRARPVVYLRRVLVGLVPRTISTFDEPKRQRGPNRCHPRQTTDVKASEIALRI